MQDICGIIPCGQPVFTPGELTCISPEHQAWYQAYKERFSRLSFPGIQRVIRRQTDTANRDPHAARLTREVELPALGDTPGTDVSHTFRARSVYCVQTVQWACGVLIGWGKCYKAESPSQVLAILDSLWQTAPNLRPGFLAYDRACDILRHIVT